MSMRDPYAAGKVMKNLYAQKADVVGRLVVVLDGRLDDRSLALIAPASRCVRRYDVHELILTDEPDARPGTAVNRIAYLGFMSVTEEGVLVEGDEVLLDGQPVGFVAGFDETHMPNHLNIVIRAQERRSGRETGAGLGQEIRFRKVAAEEKMRC